MIDKIHGTIEITPETVWGLVLKPEVETALERGRKYGDMWKSDKHITADTTALAEHVIGTHVEAKLKEAIHKLDYDDVDGMLAALGSAIGYINVLVAKLVYLGKLDITK